MRVKKVFKSSYGVAHCWAQQTQTEGRCSNMYFVGPTIYSYGRHFPAARFADDKTVLITTRTYSVTTAKHLGEIKNSIRPEFKRFFVENVMADYAGAHCANIEEIMKEIDGLLMLAAKAVKKTDLYLGQAQDLRAQAVEYNKHFKAGFKFKPLKSVDSLRELVKKQAAKVKADKIKQAAQDERDKALFFSDILPAWRLGKVYKDSKDRAANMAYCFRLFETDFLRIKKQNKNNTIVQTSKNIELIVKTGGHILDFVDRLFSDCKRAALEKTAQTAFQYKVGEYEIQRIDEQGTAFIGCHRLTLSEITYLYSQL